MKMDHLLSKIEHNFPDLPIEHYQYIDTGRNCWIMIINNQIIFRFPKNDVVMGILQKEKELLDILGSMVNTAIPHYTYLPEDDTFAGYNILPGEMLSSELYHTLAKEKQ